MNGTAFQEEGTAKTLEQLRLWQVKEQKEGWVAGAQGVRGQWGRRVGRALRTVLRMSVSLKSVRKSLKVFKQRDSTNRSDEICIFKKIVWLVGSTWIVEGKSGFWRPFRRLGQCPGDWLEDWTKALLVETS